MDLKRKIHHTWNLGIHIILRIWKVFAKFKLIPTLIVIFMARQAHITVAGRGGQALNVTLRIIDISTFIEVTCI